VIKQTTTDDLPLTSWGLLGLLSDEVGSGYDLTKRIYSGIGHFLWKPARSQVYSELARLVAHGYATDQAVAQERRPDKRVYAITEAGQAALRAWLAASPGDSDGALLLKLFFGRHVSPAVLIAHVRQIRAQRQATLDEYLRLEVEKTANGPADFYPYLTLQAGLAIMRASIAWADSVIQQLEQATPAETGQPPDPPPVQ
jgi:DNA-binding PadR family transcriptional regulator